MLPTLYEASSLVRPALASIGRVLAAKAAVASAPATTEKSTDDSPFMLVAGRAANPSDGLAAPATWKLLTTG